LTLSPEFIALVAGTFLVAGLIKGVVGLGLPTVSLAILTATVGLRDAMALMIIPSLLTNVWQMLSGPYLAEIFRRFWLLGTAAIVGTVAGVQAGVRIDPQLLAAFLGVIIVVYAASGLGRLKMPVNVREGHLIGAGMGLCSGLVTGLAGVFLIPTVLYLQGIRLSKDVFVQTLGMLFTIATVTLGVGLARHELLSADHAYVSTGAVVPAILGMFAGQKVRARLSEDRFRTVLFWALGGLGIYLILRVWE
jgi:uncharacterized membrane protein YfcA